MKLAHLYMEEYSMIDWCYSYPMEWNTEIWKMKLYLTDDTACLAIL